MVQNPKDIAKVSDWPQVGVITMIQQVLKKISRRVTISFDQNRLLFLRNIQ